MADLLVDLGNTRIKLGWLDDGLQVLAAVETPADILARVPGMPERIWLSTVARERRTEELVRTLARAERGAGAGHRGPLSTLPADPLRSGPAWPGPLAGGPWPPTSAPAGRAWSWTLERPPRST